MSDIPDEHPIRAFVIETGNLKDGFQRSCEYIAILEQRAERLERVVDEYRGAGYHPSGLKRCQHGMSRWIGSHCKYDSPALKALSEADLSKLPTQQKPNAEEMEKA